jgi:hypothetical protein
VRSKARTVSVVAPMTLILGCASGLFMNVATPSSVISRTRLAVLTPCYGLDHVGAYYNGASNLYPGDGIVAASNGTVWL